MIALPSRVAVSKDGVVLLKGGKGSRLLNKGKLVSAVGERLYCDAASFKHDHATLCSTRLAARLIIRRVVPVMIMLIPTSVPITHNEPEGHCLQTSRPRIKVMMPSTRIQPDPPAVRF